MNGQFDPMRDVPKTEEEAKIALRYGRRLGVGESLVAIFEINRIQGMTLLDAYEYALKAHLEAIEGKS